MASSAFIQFAPINSLTDMLSSSLILSKFFQDVPIVLTFMVLLHPPYLMVSIT